MSHLPLWAQHAFVGFKVAKEVAATYYRTGISIDISFRLYESDMLLKDYFHLASRMLTTFAKSVSTLTSIRLWISSTLSRNYGANKGSSLSSR
jgi:hypothetical protein